MIKLGGLVSLQPLTEEEVFTATSKETGTTSVFKSKDARDKAVKSGTHQMRKDDKKDGENKPGVNIFDKPKKKEDEPKKDEPKSEPSPSFDENEIEQALDNSVELDDFLDDNKSKFSEEDFKTLKSLKSSAQALEGDIVDAETDDDEEQMKEYEEELEGQMDEIQQILSKYQKEPKKDTPKKDEPVKNDKLDSHIADVQKNIDDLNGDKIQDFAEKNIYPYLKGNDLEVAQIYVDDIEEFGSDKEKSADERHHLKDLMKRMSLDKKETIMRIKNLLPESIINEGTRSQVGIINRNGKIASTYVHYDGYPRNMKPGIKKHLKNEKDVLQLIKRGGARGIYNDKDIEYYDDSKMKPTKGDFKDIAKYLDRTKDSWADFVYLYNMKDRKWYYADPYEDKELKKLF
tara:strand:- start:1114 stop:2319 length:1206 start_codon:yes stop_codon:yes gene_type:complete